MSRLLTRTLRGALPQLRLSSSSPSSYSVPRLYSTFKTGPAPPRLPADQQAEFERLQRSAAVSSAFQPSSSSSSPEHSTATTTTMTTTPETQTPRHASNPLTEAQKIRVVNEDDDGVNPNPLFRGAPPEFEGDVNPKTGEVGGPKNEPLRWGSSGDWSYNGRATDF